MKIRAGFVSNSSSSSFLCNVCGEMETGWDGQYSFATSYCCRGHEMCSEHIDKLVSKFTLEDKKKAVLEDEYFAETLKDEEVALINKGNSFAIEDAFERFREDWDEAPESLCPVCSLATISDGSVLRYLLKHDIRTREDIEKEIRSKYSTQDELRKGLEV
ncbi:MAG: hypothetical protein ACXAC5_05275 [Promethearchaeota archaeon]|jgi:hypothetical protein